MQIGDAIKIIDVDIDENKYMKNDLSPVCNIENNKIANLINLEEKPKLKNIYIIYKELSKNKYVVYDFMNISKPLGWTIYYDCNNNEYYYDNSINSKRIHIKKIGNIHYTHLPKCYKIGKNVFIAA